MSLATDDARFEDNVAASGGALCLISPSEDGKKRGAVAARFMNGTQWRRNAASEDGGGIYSQGSNSLFFNGSILLDNRATSKGGAIALREVILIPRAFRSCVRWM